MTDPQTPTKSETSAHTPPGETRAETRAGPEHEAPPASAPRKSGRSLRSRIRWVKRIVMLVLLVLLVLLLLQWKYCRQGGGEGQGSDRANRSDAGDRKGKPAQRITSTDPAARGRICALRVDARGVSHKGKGIDIKSAVKECRGAKRAELIVTGDATYGTVQKLQRALRAAGIVVVRRKR